MSTQHEAQNARSILLGGVTVLVVGLAPALLDEDLIAMPLLALPTMILILVAALWRDDNNIWARGVVPALAAFLPACGRAKRRPWRPNCLSKRRWSGSASARVCLHLPGELGWARLTSPQPLSDVERGFRLCYSLGFTIIADHSVGRSP